MATNVFSCADDSRVLLPLPTTACCDPVYDVIFARTRIPVFMGIGGDGAGYFPINAAGLNPPPVPGGTSGGSIVYVNGLLSRCAVYLNHVWFTDTTVVTPATEVTVEYRIKVSAYGATSTVFHERIGVTPDPNNLSGPAINSGLLCEVGGVLCQQFEFWAFVAEFGDDQPLDVQLQFCMDRSGTPAFAYDGPASIGGGELPVL